MGAIVHELEPVMLIGGGPCGARDIARVQRIAPYVVAADGGAARALEFGTVPKAVIGDLDSLSDAARAVIAPERLHRISEQDSTDFDKALRNIEAPLVLGVGFSGGRLDHQMAVLNALVRHAERRCIIVGSDDLVFLAPPHLDVSLPMGSRMSLFPMAQVKGQSRGLRWEIDDMAFAPDGLIGTSNEVAGAKTTEGAVQVTLSFNAPKMLVILPVAALTEVATQLILSPQWPAPLPVP